MFAKRCFSVSLVGVSRQVDVALGWSELV